LSDLDTDLSKLALIPWFAGRDDDDLELTSHTTDKDTRLLSENRALEEQKLLMNGMTTSEWREAAMMHPAENCPPEGSEAELEGQGTFGLTFCAVDDVSLNNLREDDCGEAPSELSANTELRVKSKVPDSSGQNSQSSGDQVLARDESSDSQQEEMVSTDMLEDAQAGNLMHIRRSIEYRKPLLLFLIYNITLSFGIPVSQ
jgi:hypothetical protein